jgi:hypothetical protein
MVFELTGYVAAKRLLRVDSCPPPNTFTYLRNLGRLDLCMENYARLDRYAVLFDRRERDLAKARWEHGD